MDQPEVPNPPLLKRDKLAITVLDERNMSLNLKAGDVVLARVNMTLHADSSMVSVSLIGHGAVSGWLCWQGGMGYSLHVGSQQCFAAVVRIEDED